MSLQRVNVDKIIKDISKQEGIEEDEIRKIAFSQFTLVAQTIKEEFYDGVRLPYFGRFYAKPGRVKYVKKATAVSTKKRAMKRKAEDAQKEQDGLV